MIFYDPSTLFWYQFIALLMCCLLNPTTIFSLHYSIGVSKHMYYLVIGVSIIIIMSLSLLLKNSSLLEESCSFVSTAMRNVYFPVTIFGWRAEMMCAENPFSVAPMKVDLFQKAPNVMSKAMASFRVHWPPNREIQKKLQYCTNVCNLWNGRFWLDSYSRLFYPMAEQQRIVDGVLHLQRFRVICQAQIPVASVTNFIPYLASK